jgi:hypothetical protein
MAFRISVIEILLYGLGAALLNVGAPVTRARFEGRALALRS